MGLSYRIIHANYFLFSHTFFRSPEKKVAELSSLTALCRFGKEAELLEILPYYQRLEDA